MLRPSHKKFILFIHVYTIFFCSRFSFSKAAISVAGLYQRQANDFQEIAAHSSWFNSEAFVPHVGLHYNNGRLKPHTHTHSHRGSAHIIDLAFSRPRYSFTVQISTDLNSF
ncbi:hypothetical protein PoB_005616000 [Plakobranchus ocellatus]|uniref:Attacin C-terminal domain-containing protein n=1 Tax=Plakobranchus ocellatus TaxID=259542 RepID=A0AAV4CE01_9GAST|nr:hypothetical protein PoB_005616000 [Plakobranchus ocellatus]